MNTPLISIIIPVYNGANYLREAIDSALAQDYPNLEVLVVNDGSRDEGATEAIALSYGDRIRYFFKENGGVSSALNLGIREMKGEYFSWLSHDDAYTPDKIRLQVEALAGYDEKDLIALTDTFQINKDSQKLSDVNGRKRFPKEEKYPWEVVLTQLLERGSFNGCALLIPRCVFDACGLFHEDLRYCQDYLMWLTIFLKGYSLVFVDKACTANRVHEGQLTQRGREIFYRDSRVLGELLIPEFAKVSTKEHDFLYGFAMYNAKYGNADVAKAALAEGKKANLISLSKRIKLNNMIAYGKIRPAIRRVYYRLFKGVKTN